MGRELVQCLLKMGSAPHICLYLCLILVNIQGVGNLNTHEYVSLSYMTLSLLFLLIRDPSCYSFMKQMQVCFCLAERKHYVTVHVSFGSFFDKVLMLGPMVEWWWSINTGTNANIIFTIYWRCLCEETIRLFFFFFFNLSYDKQLSNYRFGEIKWNDLTSK